MIARSDGDDLLSMDEVAEQLHVHWSTVYKYTKHDGLGHVNMPNGRHVKKSQLQEWIDRRSVDPGAVIEALG